MPDPTPTDFIHIKVKIDGKIEDKAFTFQKRTGALGGVYYEFGKAAKVYRLQELQEEGKKLRQDENHEFWALKVFNFDFRTAQNIATTEKISRYQDLPGLAAANRNVITETKYPEVISKFPEFEYSIVMQWIKGLSWANIIKDKTHITAEQSLRLARTLANVAAGLEFKGLAHCDLANGNFVFSADYDHIELVDLEEMYGPGFQCPNPLPVGSDGSAPFNVVEKGYWGPDADRFAGGMLIAEILCWQFSEVRQASVGDTLFASAEFRRDSKRYKLVSQYLGQINQEGVKPKELVRLFQKVWNSKTYQEYPPLREWQEALGREIIDHHPILFVEPAHSLRTYIGDKNNNNCDWTVWGDPLLNK
jgi:serine/threonine protein kinase